MSLGHWRLPQQLAQTEERPRLLPARRTDRQVRLDPRGLGRAEIVIRQRGEQVGELLAIPSFAHSASHQSRSSSRRAIRAR